MNCIGIGGARHDTSIAALIDGEFKYRKSERAFGIKHHKANDEWFKSVLDEWGIDEKDSKVVYTDSGRNRLFVYKKGQKKFENLFKPISGMMIIVYSQMHTLRVNSPISLASMLMEWLLP